MKRKILILTVVTATIIGSIVGGIIFSENNKGALLETNAISENTESSNLKDNNEENTGDEQSSEELGNDTTNNNLNQDESINKVSEVVKNKEPINTEENKEQTLLEGYEIFYKAEVFFNQGNYEEASKLYNTITNKEALAKVEFFKEELDYYMGLYDFINEANELYESGKYELARVVLYNVTGSNPSNRQKELTKDLLSKIESKINENGEKEFTFELAVEYLKASMAHIPGYEYEPWIMETSSDGTRRWLIRAKDFGYVYSVDEYGKVDTD